MNKFCLVVLRVSTESQEIELQKKEMIDYCLSLGYSKKDLIFVEGVGASAIKVNEKYQDMMIQIKQHIIKKDIESVAVWHMNRLGRNDNILIQIKNLLIDNGIQLYCKNPSLKLLDDDGKVNSGMELAFTLFATLCKQDMIEKQEKFKRSKSNNSQLGKFNGGKVKFGYKLNKDNYYIVNEDEAKIIRLIFELYSSGKYSCYTLANELNLLGYTYRELKFNSKRVNTILNDSSFIGRKDSQYIHRNYPRIISNDLFNQVKKVSKVNNYIIVKGKRDLFASKLITCSCCGTHYLPFSYIYRCSKSLKCCVKRNSYLSNDLDLCSNVSISIIYLDSLLWRLASEFYMSYLMNLNESSIKEYSDKIETDNKKIITLQNDIKLLNQKKEKVVDSYIEDIISKDVRDKKILYINQQIDNIKNQILFYKEDISNITKLVDSINTDISNVNNLVYITESVIGEHNNKKMSAIVHKYIINILIKDIECKFTKRMQDIEITFINGSKVHYYYAPYLHKFYYKTDNEYKIFELDIIWRDKKGNCWTELSYNQNSL